MLSQDNLNEVIKNKVDSLPEKNSPAYVDGFMEGILFAVDFIRSLVDLRSKKDLLIEEEFNVKKRAS